MTGIRPSLISASRRRFNPLSLSPALWLDASDSSTLFDATSGGSLVAADGAVARWEDKSGNSRHATQSGSTARPLRKTSVLNGRDVLRFDGSNDYLICASASDWVFLHNSVSTFFAVFRAGDVSEPNAVYVLAGTTFTVLSPGGAYYAYDDRTSVPRSKSISHVVGYGNARIINARQNSIPGNQFGITSIISDPNNSTSGQRSFIWTDGTGPTNGNAETGSSPSSSNPRHALAIGAAQNSSNVFTAHLLGDIAEILVFPTALSTADRQRVESFLSQKYNIALA